jgi:hypothetical protein
MGPRIGQYSNGRNRSVDHTNDSPQRGTKPGGGDWSAILMEPKFDQKSKVGL